MASNYEQEESEFDRTVRSLKGGSRQELGASDYLSGKIPGSQAAETLRLSLKSGLPLDTVFRDIPDAKARTGRLPAQEIERLEREAPILSNRLKEPYRMSAYKEDLAQLERIEKLTKQLRNPVYRPSTDAELRKIVEPQQRARAAQDFPRQPSTPQLVGDLGDSIPLYRTEQEMAEAYTQEGIRSLKAKEAFIQGDTERMGYGHYIAQSILQGAEAGVTVREFTAAGLRKKSGERSPQLDAEIERLQKKMSSTPEGGDFFARIVYPASKLIGQMADAAGASLGRGVQGAMMGMAVGAGGGPAAPITAPAATVKGFGIGMTVGMAEQAFRDEAGGMYLELDEVRGPNGERIDESTKQAISTTVGAVNAAIEMIGLKVLSAPFKAMVKRWLGEAAKEAVVLPTIKKAAAVALKNYGLGAVGETSTEGLQELVSVVGEDLAKRATEGEFTTLSDPAQRAKDFERIMSVVSETFRGSLLVALPGPTVNFASESRKAKQTQELLTEIDKTVQQIKLAETNPEEIESIAKTAAEEIGVPFLHVNAREAMEFHQSKGEPDRVAELTGLSNGELQQIAEANGDIQLPTEKYVSMPKEEKAFYQPKIRKDPNDMSAAEVEQEIKAQDDVEKQRVAEVERVKKKEAAQAAKTKIDASVARIKEILEQAAEAAGLKSEVTSDSLKLVEAAFKRIGERSGLDPLELFQKYGLTVFKQDVKAPAEGTAYEQPADGTHSEHVVRRARIAELESQIKDQEEHLKSFVGWFGSEEAARKVPNQKTGDLTIDKEFQLLEKRKAELAELRKAEPEGQIFEQPGDTGESRGRLQIGKNRKMSIEFFKGLADKSTFPHEFMGHFYLELLGDVAERPDATQEIRDDYRKILDYMGATDRAGITEPMHEKWSRTIEKYLETGQAPSKKLRGVFNRFARLIASIYKEAKGYFSGVNLTPELRDVLDRIFATQEAIEEMRVTNAATQLIPEIEQAVKAGLLTPEEGDRLAEAVREDMDEAEAQLTEEMFKDYNRKREATWKKEVAAMHEIVLAEANALPQYIAASIFRDGVMPDGSKPPEVLEGKKLHRKALTEMGLEHSALKDMSSNDHDVAIDPETAAEALNFQGAHDLVNVLQNLEPKEQYVTRVIDERMEDLHGPPLQPEEIRQKAVEALHGTHRRKLLRTQMEILAAKHPEALRAGIKAIGRRVPSTETLRDAARKMIGAQAASKVDPRLYQAAEKRAAREAADLFAKGDIPASLDAKIREAVNHERFLAAVEARNDASKILKHLLSMRTREAQERIGKGNPEAVDQIHKLLERYELKPSRMTPENRQTVTAWIAEQRANGYEPAIAEMLEQEGEKKSFKDATIDELRDLDEAVRSIEAIAKREREVRVLNKYLDKELAVKELVDKAELLKSVKKAPEKILRNFMDRVKQKLVSYDLQAVPMESLMEELDGGAVGPWHDYFFNRSSEAQSTEYDLTREITEKIVNLTENYMKGNPDSIKDLILTTLQDEPMSRYRLMSIILNMGTESSLEKMIRGEAQRGNEWTDEKLRAAAANLSRRDLKYIQDVWNALETLYPKVADIEKRVSGVAAPKLEARPFSVTLNSGETVEMQGGYYPLKYDPELSDVGRKQESGVLAGLVEEGYTPATTPGSHRKARTGFAAPLLYDFNQIVQKHLAGVIKDISHREFLIDAQKLLRDPRIRKALQDKLGSEYEALFQPWLKSIASDGVAPQALSGFSKFLEKARSNVTTVALGYKLGTMLAQLAGLPNSFEYIQSHYGAKYFADAFWQFSRSPLETYKFVTEKSGEMRNRWKSLDRDARYNMRDLVDVEKGPAGTVVKLKQNIEKGAYIGINVMDRFVSVPTWMAAYNAVMEKAMTDSSITEDQAIHAADAAVRRSQGAGGAKDLSAAQRERGAAKIFTMFMTPFIAQYGRLHNLGRGFRESKSKLASVPGLAFKVAMITMLPQIIAEFLTREAPEDETPEEKVKRYAKKAAWSLASPLPYIRDVANAAERYIERGNPRDVRISPVVDAAEKLWKTGIYLGEATFGDREMDDALAFDAFETSGYLSGLPTAQPRITLEAIYDMLTDGPSSDNPGTLLRDMVFRRPKERNPK